MIIGVPAEIKDKEFRIGIVPAGVKTLTNATLPYALEIANKGIITAAAENKALKRDINVYKGVLCNKEAAKSQGKEWRKFKGIYS